MSSPNLLGEIDDLTSDLIDGQTQLHHYLMFAIENRDLPQVQIIHDQILKLPNEPSMNDYYALNRAVFLGFNEIVEYICSNINSDSISDLNKYNLMFGAVKWNTSLVQILHEWGVDIESEISWFGSKYVDRSIKEGDESIIRYLCDHGAKAEISKISMVGSGLIIGRSSIKNAMRYHLENRFDLILYLLEKGADIDHEYDLPILWAIENSDLKGIEFLHGLGASISTSNLIPSVVRADISVVKFLCELGLDITPYASPGLFHSINKLDYRGVIIISVDIFIN